MAQTILTAKQHQFLECVGQNTSITKRFYLTGGTALAEFYLHHRLSEDIDLFTEEHEVNDVVVTAFLKKIGPSLGVTEIKPSQFLGLVSYLLKYRDGEQLKVDFNYYPFPRIEKGVQYGKLSVDSLYDIVVNKIHTLFMKPRNRDYVDIYYAMKSQNYSLDKLILDAKAKFDWHIDRVTLASQFIRVRDIKVDEFPKMLIPFSVNDMERFFLRLAKQLEGEIFE